MYKYSFSILVALLSFSSVVFSQDVIVKPEDKIRAEADSLFAAKQYLQALPLYDELLEQYPKDKATAYALGVCCFNGSHNYKRAFELLDKASTGEVPNMVYFYLAELYRFGYHFEKAIDYYRRYTVNGASGEVGTDRIEALVSNCENGSYITRYIYKPIVLDVKNVALDEVGKYFSLAPKSGSFTYAPENLRTNQDRKMEHKPLIFYPNNPQVGDYIYYSSYGKTLSYGKDIYRIQLLSDGKWSKPEALDETVNTNFDEDFPYLATDGVSLYFASKGHYGMGGYDIYRSVFDNTTNKWGTPENLGFPFSSPFDDFFYVQGEVDTLVAFATGRNVLADSIQIVLLAVDEAQVRQTAKSEEQIAEYASLSINKKNDEKPAEKSQSQVAKPAVAKKPQKSASFRAVENDPEYSRAIAKGFEEQMKADSSRVKLEKLREKFDYVETAEQRIKLEKQVSIVEKTMLEAQKQADLMFVSASQIEQEYLTGKRKPQGRVESTFATDNPDFIYQAQFATTVFQDNEISKLSQVEQLYTDMVARRVKALELRERYKACVEKSGDETDIDCGNEFNSMISAMKGYNGVLKRYFEQKYPIYNECVHVAIVKSGSSSDEIRDIYNSAIAHTRSASTIMNNLTDEGRIESEFEASLLRELGLLRMDFAFAKVWGMELMVKRLTERIVKLDFELFGSSSLASKPKPEIVADDETSDNVNAIKIERVDESEEQVVISIKSEIPTDFGIVDTMVYSEANPIPIVKTQPDGVIYRIQIGAYGTVRQPSFFKKMVPVSGIRAGKVTKYYIGCLTTYAEAEKALQTVKTRGFKDAFIVSWYNGKTVAVSRAKSLENEIPETQENSSSSVKNNASDNNASGTQIYIVQIGAYQGSMPEDDLKTVKTLVSGKEISRKIDSQGAFVYSVGSFTTITEAEKIKDNLVASGLLKAMVVTVDM